VNRDSQWWQQAVIYQIYPLSFQDSDGDGKGDLNGILSHLEYLRWLGINAVWLGPVYPSPMADFGYDVTDFIGVDPVFGSLDCLDRLIDELHAQNIRLIMDFVPNHTSNLHPWFLESRSSSHNKKSDWFVWADAAPDGGPPNNWLSRFGGSAWEWDSQRGQFYSHAFLKEQPDLNWRNAEVRSAMAEVLRFWLRRGVDGFRIDAAAVLAEDRLLRNEPLNPDFDEHTPPPERFKRLYTDSQPEVLDWLADLRKVIDEFPGRVLLAEVDTSPEKIAQFYGEKNHPIIHLPLNYRLLDNPWEASEIAAMINEYRNSVPEHGWPNWVIGSHDKKRIAATVGPEQARIAAMLFLTLPGTPIFFAGDELGMAGGKTDWKHALDPFERLVPGFGLNRDPERTPMQWNAGRNAGFTCGKPWLPIAPDSRERNVEDERRDEGSILHLYRSLIALRRKSSAIAFGGYKTLLVTRNILAYERTNAEERILIVLNFADQFQTCRIPEITGGRVIASTQLSQKNESLSADQITIGPNEGVIISPATAPRAESS
jgi:alpha-glucosidase